jgi:hypothetical protein
MKVVSTIFSEMSGKLGGLVFMNQPSGIVCRIKNNLVNNKSISRQQSKSIFASSFAGWNELTAVQKSSWVSWSLANYSSASHPSGHSVGGYQGYRGVYTCLRNFLSKTSGFSLVCHPGTNVRTFSQSVLDFSLLPLGVRVTNAIADTIYPFKVLSLKNPIMNFAASCVFDVQFGDPAVALIAGQQFVNPSGLRFGFSVYVSEALNNISAVAKNPFALNIFNSGIFSVNSLFLTGFSSCSIGFDCKILSQNSKYGIQPGKCYLFTLVAIGENGTMSIIGSKNVLCNN